MNHQVPLIGDRWWEAFNIYPTYERGYTARTSLRNDYSFRGSI